MFHGVLSVVFAALLLAVVLGLYAPPQASADEAMWAVFWLGLAALFYTSFQGLDALRKSMAPNGRAFLALPLSFLPLLVAAYAVAVWQYSPDRLSTYQIVATVLASAAALIDVFAFSWLWIRSGRGRGAQPEQSSG